ncbi:MAG: hypothetical protein ACE5NC_09650 [Anaerolineae bacterium]
MAIFLTLNPLAATVLGVALLDEPMRFAVGFLAVAAGIVAVMRGMTR